MKLRRVGEKSRAICNSCEQVRPTTFKERNVPLSGGRGSVPNVIVAVCDHCDEVVAVPQQSVPKVNKALRAARKPVEARIPRHLEDIPGLSCAVLGFDSSHESMLFRYYVVRVSKYKRLQRRLDVLSSSDEARGKANGRFSVKLGPELHEALRSVEKATKLNTARVIKGLLIQMKHDIADKKQPDVSKELQELLLFDA